METNTRNNSESDSTLNLQSDKPINDGMSMSNQEYKKQPRTSKNEWRKIDKKLGTTILYSFVYLGSYIVFFNKDSQLIRSLFLIIAIFLYLFLKLDLGFFRSLFLGLTLQIPGLILIFYFVEYRIDSAILYAMNYYISIYFMVLVSYIFIKKISMMEVVRIFRFFGLGPSLSTIIAISIVFLPLLLENLRKIYLMQKLRGYSMMRNGLEPILIPAIGQLFDYSMALALSCYQRGLFF